MITSKVRAPLKRNTTYIACKGGHLFLISVSDEESIRIVRDDGRLMDVEASVFGTRINLDEYEIYSVYSVTFGLWVWRVLGISVLLVLWHFLIPKF